MATEEQKKNLLPGTAPLGDLTEQLHERRAKAKLGGGSEKIAKQHERGKLTARERIELLVDEGTFVEMGIHGRPHFAQRMMDGVEAPADGVITGWGDVDGRPCCIAAYDFTVMAGSMGMTASSRSPACARWPSPSGCPSSGCSTRPGPASRRRRARSSPAPATSSARRSRCRA
ncbi:MAG TPA: carboxyl transferase domain-containing protein [Solirubrobacterales bacterium]|nr:carboxyl transferase domain-containing protein [Solirubrobacterales bacterium]